MHRVLAAVFLFTCLTAATWVQADEETVILERGADWRYLDGGVVPAPGWKQPSFNDSAWKTGPAPLGYGDDKLKTEIDKGAQDGKVAITAYFRHTFSLPEAKSGGPCTLRIRKDDGAAIYINGKEIGRLDLPKGDLAHDTKATTRVTAMGEIEYQEIRLEANALTAGNNVVAVEVHQAVPSSSDLIFDLEIITARIELRKGPYLTYGGDNTTMRLDWQLNTRGPSRLAWGPEETRGEPVVTTSEYGDDHQHAHTFTGLTPGKKYYYRLHAGEHVVSGAFHAAPPEDVAAITFMSYGDTRTFPLDHNKVAGAVVGEMLADSRAHTFILAVGDIVSKGAVEASWTSEFFDPKFSSIKTLLANAPFQSCLGNHGSWGGPTLFTKYFKYPYAAERYWSFDYGPAHFCIVDQYVPYGKDSKQLAWIEKDLSESKKPWKFLCLHEPGWSAGAKDNEKPVQEFIHPLCKKYGVQIVFAGDQHFYSRAVVDGIHHVTTAGGGAPFHTPRPGMPHIVTYAKAHHYCKVEIDGDQLRFMARTPEGKVLDRFEMKR